MFFCFTQQESSSKKRCKCTQKKCNEQIFLTFFFAKMMRKEYRGETLRIAERWEVRAARAVMGAVRGVRIVRIVGGVAIVLINRIINFGKGHSLISYQNLCQSVVMQKGGYTEEELFFDVKPDFVVTGTGEDVITIVLIFYLIRTIFC